MRIQFDMTLFFIFVVGLKNMGHVRVRGRDRVACWQGQNFTRAPYFPHTHFFSRVLSMNPNVLWGVRPSPLAPGGDTHLNVFDCVVGHAFDDRPT